MDHQVPEEKTGSESAKDPQSEEEDNDKEDNINKDSASGGSDDSDNDEEEVEGGPGDNREEEQEDKAGPESANDCPSEQEDKEDSISNDSTSGGSEDENDEEEVEVEGGPGDLSEQAQHLQKDHDENKEDHGAGNNVQEEEDNKKEDKNDDSASSSSDDNDNDEEEVEGGPEDGLSDHEQQSFQKEPDESMQDHGDGNNAEEEGQDKNNIDSAFGGSDGSDNDEEEVVGGSGPGDGEDEEQIQKDHDENNQDNPDQNNVEAENNVEEAKNNDESQSEEEEDSESDDSSDDSDSDSDDSNSDSDHDDKDEEDQEGTASNSAPDDGLSEYERLRKERIRRNQERLQSLGLLDESNKPKRKQQQKRQRKERESLEPTRKSRRSIEPKKYTEPSIRQVLGSVKGQKLPREKKEKPPKQPKIRKPSARDKRPTREIYAEFQHIKKRKRQTLKEAHKHLKAAQKEVNYWQKKATVALKRELKEMEKQDAQQQRIAAKWQELQAKTQVSAAQQKAFGNLTAKEFLASIDARKAEIQAKMEDYDQRTMTPEQIMELEAKKQEQANRLKLLDANHVVRKALKSSARTLTSCLLHRTPKDLRPPPRRNKPRRGTFQDDDNNNEELKQPKKKRRRTKSQPPPAPTDDSTIAAATRASLSQTERLLQQSSQEPPTDDNHNSPTKTTKKKPREKRDINVGGWVTAAFANRIDRSWLDQDGPHTQQGSLKTYVPQPGDTVLYYPVGHYEFLSRYPDHLCNRRIARIPLWERAQKERAKKQKERRDNKEEDDDDDDKESSDHDNKQESTGADLAAAQDKTPAEAVASSPATSPTPAKTAPKISTVLANNQWWSSEWIDQAAAGEHLLPILCRVEKTQAEFPPEQAEVVFENGASKKSRKRPVLRLAVTLRPLTSVTPPSWRKDQKDDSPAVLVDPPSSGKDLESLAPVFTCVTFPSSQVDPFLVPFAWSYIKNHSLVVGDEVGHSPEKASVTGKPLHQKGKLLSLATIDETYGSFRLDDKLAYLANVLAVTKKETEDAAKAAEETSTAIRYTGRRKVESLYGMTPQDTFVIGEFIEGFLHKFVAKTTAEATADKSSGASSTEDVDLMTIVRSSFPVWKAAVVQKGFEDRTRLELQPWDVKPKDIVAPSLKHFLEVGLHNTLDNVLRLKIECSLEGYLLANPDSFQFQEQITESDAVGYGTAVPITMSFRRVLARLKQRGKRPDANSPCYYRCFDAILADIQSIEENCRLYNSPDSPLAKTAMEVAQAAKRFVSGLVTSYVREQKDKLKEDDAKKQFIAALVGGNDESPDNPSESQNVKGVDPFKEPWKGALFRDWIQLTSPDLPRQNGHNQQDSFSQWVPQAGDEVLYSKEMHTKFLEGHLDSLSANQVIVLDDTVAKEATSPSSGDLASRDLPDVTSWMPAKVLSVRAEFPRVRKPNEEGSFITKAPLLVVTIQSSDTAADGEKTTSAIYWRPCMFPKDIPETADRTTLCCSCCGLQVSSSFLRPAWSDQYGKATASNDDSLCAPCGFAREDILEIAKNLDFLKRRCLLETMPDKLDENLTTEQIKNGFVPDHFKVGYVPEFDSLLKPESEMASKGTRGSNTPQINKLALSSLAAVGFLPPWLPSLGASAHAKKGSAIPLHEAVSPWPSLCLELISIRIKNGYYRHLEAVHNDLVEAFLNTQLLTWAPHAKRKHDPLSMKKVAKALNATKYAHSTDSAPFTPIVQAVTATTQKTAEQATASIKVRIVFDEPGSPAKAGRPRKKSVAATASPPVKKGRGRPRKHPIAEDAVAAKENVRTPTKNPKQNGVKAPKEQGKSSSRAKGSKRNARVSSQPSTSDDCQELLVAEVPVGSLRSLGKQESTWVSCDKCGKWRRLRGLIDQNNLPSRWYCSMNKTDPERAKCSAPQEALDDTNDDAKENAVENEEDDDDSGVLTEKESSFAAHTELLRRLYAASLVGISEPTHFAFVFGVKSLHVNRQNPKIVPKKAEEGDHEAALARKQLGLLIKAMERDTTNNQLSPNITLKISVRGKHVSGEVTTPVVSESDPTVFTESVVTVHSVHFGKRDLNTDDELTSALYGKSLLRRSLPCVRCQAVRKGLYTCRVLRSHSSIDFDLIDNFQEGGGIDRLLCTMLKEPMPDPSTMIVDKPVSEGDMEELRSVGNNSGGNKDDGDDGDLKEAGKNLGENDVHEVNPGEMYNKALETLTLAQETLEMAEEYAEAPDRLSNEFIATTFPYDPRDNSYVYCIICGVSGDLLLCDNKNCPNVMHHHCGGLQEIPEADWFCGECVTIPSAGDEAATEQIAKADGLESASGENDKMSTASVSSAANNKSEEDEAKERDGVSPTAKEAKIDADTNKTGDGVSPTAEEATPDADNEDTEQGEKKKPATVTSHLPPIVTFDFQKAAKLATDLGDLYYHRTGRRRARKDGEDEDDGQIRIGTLFQKRFGHQGWFTGEVICLPTEDGACYRVRYHEDDDEEDLTEEELQNQLIKTRKRKEKLKKKKTRDGGNGDDEEGATSNPRQGKRKRGRPRKNPPEEEDTDEEPEPKRKRGRPRKNPPEEEDTDEEPENGKRRQGRYTKTSLRAGEDHDEEEAEKSRSSKQAKSVKFASEKADWKDKDPILALPEVMKNFLASQKIVSARVFMASKSGDLAAELVKWRKKNKLPALRGSGAAATISGAKGIVRRTIEENDLEPLPEMKRNGLVYPAGQKGNTADHSSREPTNSSDNTGTIEEVKIQQTSRSKRKIAPPKFFAQGIDTGEAKSRRRGRATK